MRRAALLAQQGVATIAAAESGDDLPLVGHVANQGFLWIAWATGTPGSLGDNGFMGVLAGASGIRVSGAGGIGVGRSTKQWWCQWVAKTSYPHDTCQLPCPYS